MMTSILVYAVIATLSTILLSSTDCSTPVPTSKPIVIVSRSPITISQIIAIMIDDYKIMRNNTDKVLEHVYSTFSAASLLNCNL